MSTRDDFDELLAARMRAAAPQEAPHHLMDSVIDRVAVTPQRRRGPLGWLGSPAARLSVAAAVLVAAVIAGAQFGGLFGRATGADPSPDPSPSAAASTAPSSATPSPSDAGTASAAPSSPAPEAGASGSDLVLRFELGFGGPTYPSHLLPEFSLMADGTVIWLPVPASTEIPSLATRTLTPDGLTQLREHLFGSGLLDESATHQLERRPDAGEPPGHGVNVYTFTAVDGEETPTVVTSVQWLGDDEESTYYQPAPERQQLDVLALELQDPEAILPADAWAGPASVYLAPDYQLVLTPTRDRPPYQTTDSSEIPWPFEGPLEEYGEAVGGAGTAPGGCGIITGDEAAAIIDMLVSAGQLAGPSMATSVSLDWAEGNGVVDVFLLPRMPDGYPECTDQP